MIAIVGGGIAAFCWGVSTVLAGRSSRQIGAASTLAWVGIAGAIVITPVVIWYGVPKAITLDGNFGGAYKAASLVHAFFNLVRYARGTRTKYKSH